MASREVKITYVSPEPWQKRVSDRQAAVAAIFSRVARDGPGPDTAADFYRLPHQQGIEHGPYLPLADDEDPQAQSSHQLHEHSRALGTAWFRGKVSDESAAAIDGAIEDAIDQIVDDIVSESPGQ